MEALDKAVESIFARNAIQPKMHHVLSIKGEVYKFPDSTFWVSVEEDSLYIYRSYNKEHRQLVGAFADGEWSNVIAIEED